MFPDISAEKSWSALKHTRESHKRIIEVTRRKRKKEKKKTTCHLVIKTNSFLGFGEILHTKGKTLWKGELNILNKNV